MGLFDQFIKKPEIKDINYKPLSDFEAWIGILYACMSSDGVVSDVEIDSLSRMIVHKQKFSGIDIAPLYDTVAEAKLKIGGIGLIEACSEFVNESDKDTLFSMAIEIVLADGILDIDEQKVIELIADRMKIDTELVEKIIQVMLIRNRGNVIIVD
ncbi:tellurite resistance TerB family protein [Psychroserpens ponticola]|uniref:Tellurite resistance TerB family protein n=1 Tax=Psychroserpens ponticola TaxID=2932268 RepID=A0ABY7RZ85_9FLAO|nr:tellurite resistance TerB family protein [Psychroserpens ponticola]WCO02459.1 tellurite resistance TerB family protein [Psychroserpens ponticola]